MSSEPTTRIVLDTRRPTKEKKYPVKLRVTYQRKYKYYRIPGYYFTKDEYSKVISEKARGINKDVQLEFKDIEKEANQIIKELPEFTFEKFEAVFLINEERRKDFYYVMDQYIQQLKSQNRYGTAESYSSSYHVLQKYKPALNFDEITPEFLQGFENWMLDLGKSYTTIGIYGRNIRRIFNIGINQGYVKKEAYPFGKDKYQIPAGKNIKKALTLEEIKTIYHYETIPGTNDDWSKDIWLFSYLTNGINIADIARLKYKNIDNDYITFSRYKTINTAKSNQRKTQAFLTDVSKNIIKKWGNPAEPDNYIFPVLHEGMTKEDEHKRIKQTTKTINKYIKRIGKASGIQKEITTYHARHSFATILMQTGAPLKFISDSLLHSGIKTTENYLGSFEDDTKKKYIERLTDFED